jgi:hypothetical protein
MAHNNANPRPPDMIPLPKDTSANRPDIENAC